MSSSQNHYRATRKMHSSLEGGLDGWAAQGWRLDGTGVVTGSEWGGRSCKQRLASGAADAFLQREGLGVEFCSLLTNGHPKGEERVSNSGESDLAMMDNMRGGGLL